MSPLSKWALEGQEETVSLSLTDHPFGQQDLKGEDRAKPTRPGIRAGSTPPLPGGAEGSQHGPTRWDGAWEDHGLAFCLTAPKEKGFLLLPRFQEGEASCGGLRWALRKNLFKEEAKETAMQRLLYLTGSGMRNTRPRHHHYPSQAHSRVPIIELNQ